MLIRLPLHHWLHFICTIYTKYYISNYMQHHAQLWINNIADVLCAGNNNLSTHFIVYKTFYLWWYTSLRNHYSHNCNSFERVCGCDRQTWRGCEYSLLSFIQTTLKYIVIPDIVTKKESTRLYLFVHFF